MFGDVNEGPIQLDEVTFRGSGLSRPECLVTHESGLIFAADWQGAGGVACITPVGGVTRISAERPADDPLRPNGIALEPGGTFLIAHLGAEREACFVSTRTGNASRCCWT